MPRHCLRIRLQLQKQLREAFCCHRLRLVPRYKAGKAPRNLLNSMQSTSPRRLARPRTSPFHGGNTGSNPVGDANKINSLAVGAGNQRRCGADTGPIESSVSGRQINPHTSFDRRQTGKRDGPSWDQLVAPRCSWCNRLISPIMVWHGMDVGLTSGGCGLSCDCRGVVFLPNAYMSTDSGATTGFRLDGQFSIHQAEPLTHADQANPSTTDGIPPIETNAGVTHTQTDFVLSAVHFHCEVLSTAMLCGILQSFLKDSKQAK